jgi:hypothetical protein
MLMSILFWSSKQNYQKHPCVNGESINNWPLNKDRLFATILELKWRKL